MSFYEVIIRVPHDVEDQLPGVSDSFVDWIVRKEWELPDWSDMDITLIDQPQLTLAEKIQREFLSEWQKITKEKETPHFVQLEKGEKFYHLHTLVSTEGMKSMVLGRYLNQIRQKLVSQIYRGVEPQIPDWMAVTKVKKEGANRIRDTQYIPAYLLPKTQSELQWAWTNLEEYKLATLNLAERKRLSEQYQTEFRRNQPASDSQISETDSGNPRWRGKSTARYMELVKWLVERGITSEKQWIQEDQESYLSFNSTGTARGQIKAALDNAGRIMSTTKSASDYLIGPHPPEDVKNNRVYRIFELNGYDPKYAGSVLVGWCRKEFGKRNTIWLFGPATTGKTNIAEAIAHAVPFYGCVNWTNENFPFNDCVDKMIIWWEEGKMTAKVVESAKAILGGSMVRVDQKCKSSQQIEQTPVIVTSNTNMCAVIDGNSTTFEHQQPLEDRMFKFELTRRLEPDFGKISKREIREFMNWAESNKVPVTHEFRVKKFAPVFKRPAPEGEESEGINSRKRFRSSSFDEESSERADVENFALRYVNKCSRHLNFVTMMFPCQICDRMNQSVDVCFTHGAKSCEICFPRSDPDGQIDCIEMGESEKTEKEEMPENRCNTCKMRNIVRPNCGLCAEIALECIDDLNKEQ
uniref:NS1 protein n=1 Tax=Rhinolophus ferrumequinum adeno-associated virus TaxID=3140012 RepID=A0AAU6S504_9VIRU